MRVLFYINTLERGGAERVISNLANQFSQNNHESILLSSYYRDKEYKLDEKVKRFYLEDYIGKPKSRLYKNLKMIYYIRRVIKNENPDVVVSFTKEPSVRAVMASFSLNTKTIISIRNDPVVNYSGFINSIIAKYIYPKADGCVFQTLDSQSYFKKKLQNKSKIIPNQVANVFFETVREDTDYIVSIGNLYSDKNHLLLINAFENILKEFPNEKLYIYGKGDLEQELTDKIKEKRLEESIFLMGSTNDVPDVLSKAKIFALTSNHEGMPNALLEALAVGVPSIATDCPCGGPKSVIEPGENGFLIPVNNQTELENKMKMLLEDDNLSTYISENAKKSANEFRPDVVFKDWEDYLYEVLDNWISFIFLGAYLLNYVMKYCNRWYWWDI